MLLICLRAFNQGPLMLHTSKQYPSQDATSFHVFGRVMSGTSKIWFPCFANNKHLSSVTVNDQSVLRTYTYALG